MISDLSERRVLVLRGGCSGASNRNHARGECCSDLGLEVHFAPFPLGKGPLSVS